MHVPLLHALQRAFPDAVDLSLMVDPEAQEQYWSNAVKRTEEMLDEVYDRLKATHGEFAIRLSRPNPDDAHRLSPSTELATFTSRR